MKELQTRRRRLAWLCSLALVVAACDSRSNPASPSSVFEPLKNEVALCHRTSGGTYVKIVVSGSAKDSHVAHGDGVAGGSSFDENCAVKNSEPPPPPPPPPLTLTCGAPAGATNPGSTQAPGPTVNATMGATLEFAVTASPAPAGSLLMLREIRDTSSTGVVVNQALVPLSDGRYQGSMFTSGGLSFVREMRFTFDTASCSLFWNINP